MVKRKRRSSVKKDSSGHTKLTRELENLRKQYTTRIKQFAKTAEVFKQEGNRELYTKYSKGAEHLEYERQQLIVKNITKEKAGTKAYEEAIKSKLKEARETISAIPSSRNRVSYETLGRVRFKHSTNVAILAYQMGIWGEGDNIEERTRKMREYVARETGVVDSSEISEADIVDYFEQVLNEISGREYDLYDDSYIDDLPDDYDSDQILALLGY